MWRSVSLFMIRVEKIVDKGNWIVFKIILVFGLERKESRDGGVDNLEKMEKLINWLFLLGERIRVSGKGIEFSLEWDVL